MRNMLAKSGKIVLFTAILLMIAMPAFSQTKRKPKKKKVRPVATSTQRIIITQTAPVVSSQTLAAPATKDKRALNSSRTPRALSPSVNRQRIAMDYENDGKADLAVFRPNGNTWFIAKSSGGTITQPFGVASSDYIVPGDYDGDGKGDLAVYRDTEGKWYIMYSSTSVLHTVTFGTIGAGDEPVARDYDGDGKTDLAFVNRSGSTMTWKIRKSTANPLDTDAVVESTNWGVSTDSTAPGDYDGDGKYDLSVRRAGNLATDTATFITKRSSDGVQENVSWGLGTDLVIPGDYDGDGKTDYAVLREGKLDTDTLMWIIRRSSDATAVVVNFGVTGTDYNVQNDYDGDGKTDIAIWRNSTGTFSVMQSSTNTTVNTAFGQPNDYPIASYDTH